MYINVYAWCNKLPRPLQLCCKHKSSLILTKYRYGGYAKCICLQINIRSQIFPSSNVATQNSCTCIQLLYYIDLSASCCCCRLDRREYTLSSHVNDACTYLFLMQSKTTLVVCLVVCFQSPQQGSRIKNLQLVE